MRSLKKHPVINCTVFRKIKNLFFKNPTKESKKYLNGTSLERTTEDLFLDYSEKYKQQKIFEKFSVKENGLLILKENFFKKQISEDDGGTSFKNKLFLAPKTTLKKKKQMLRFFSKLPSLQKKKKEDFDFFSKLKIPHFKIFNKNFKFYNFFFEKKISLYTGKRLVNVQVFSKEMLSKNPGQFSFNKKITSNIHTLKKKKKK